MATFTGGWGRRQVPEQERGDGSQKGGRQPDGEQSGLTPSLRRRCVQGTFQPAGKGWVQHGAQTLPLQGVRCRTQHPERCLWAFPGLEGGVSPGSGEWKVPTVPCPPDAAAPATAPTASSSIFIYTQHPKVGNLCFTLPHHTADLHKHFKSVFAPREQPQSP